MQEISWAMLFFTLFSWIFYALSMATSRLKNAMKMSLLMTLKIPSKSVGNAKDLP